MEMNNGNSITELVEQIDLVVTDITISRNIRDALLEVKSHLTSGDEADINVRKDDAQLRLIDIADDPNIPINGRTLVWDILSKIESL